MPLYFIASSQNLRDEFRAIQDRAKAQGMEVVVAKTLAMILSQLESSPTAFGDPTFHYRELKLTNYVVTRESVAVNYCVDEARKIVYLRRIVWTAR